MNKKLIGVLAGMIFLGLTVAGCGSGSQSGPTAGGEVENSRRVATPATAEVEVETDVAAEVEDDAASVEVEPAVGVAAEKEPATTFLVLPKPENELAEGEYHWQQLLPRDGIRPIYEDEIEFVEAKSAPYDDDELVIGVEINGEAKAYAIGPLNTREMVNDVVGGTPVLVTW